MPYLTVGVIGIDQGDFTWYGDGSFNFLTVIGFKCIAYHFIVYHRGLCYFTIVQKGLLGGMSMNQYNPDNKVLFSDVGGQEVAK